MQLSLSHGPGVDENQQLQVYYSKYQTWHQGLAQVTNLPWI